MSRSVTIVTPENITLTYRLAGFASRSIAVFVDLVIQALILIALAFARSGLGAFDRFGMGGIFSAASSIAIFVVIFVYPVIFEMTWAGRTPGKRLLGLRVICDGGYPINLNSSILRNVLRFIDVGLVPLGATGPPLFLLGLPGVTSIFLSNQNKRIGDYAGGTLVIVEGGSSRSGWRRDATTIEGAVASFLPLVRNLDRLTVDEYVVVRRFTSRRREMDLVAQAAVGTRLARPLMDRLGIEAPIHYQLQYADMLEAIERRYAEDRGLL